MRKPTIIILIIINSLIATSRPATIEVKPAKKNGFVNIGYYESFEDKSSLDTIKKWTGKAEVEIKKELVTSKITDGNKALKITIKFISRRIYYLQIPLDIPLEGSCFLRMNFFIEKNSTAKFFPGVNMALPPTRLKNMCANYRDTTKGEWHSLRMDLVERGQNMSKYVAPLSLPGMTPLTVGKKLKGIAFMFIGEPGQEATVYIDKIELTGTVPDSRHYDSTLKRRKQKAEETLSNLAGTWQKEITAIKNDINEVKTSTQRARDYKSIILNKIESIEKDFIKIFRTKKISSSSREKIAKIKYFKNAFIKNINYFNNNLSKKIIIYKLDPMLPFRTLPDTKLIGGEVSDNFTVNIAPGEYEPISFVIHAKTALKNIRIEASDLLSKLNKISKNNMDIKIVKAWYQRKTSIASPVSTKDMKGVLVPELLLNNDKLIKVDYNNKNNYALINGKYVLISQRKVINAKKARIPSIKDFPIEDSKKLEDFDIKENQNKQIWITAYIPVSKKSGIYEGELKIYSGDNIIKTLKLKINVLPFKLEKAGIISSMYYRTYINEKNSGSISGEYKTRQQFSNELKDLVSHGVDTPTIFQAFMIKNNKFLDEYLSYMKKYGLNTKTAFNLGVITVPKDYKNKPDLVNRLVSNYQKQDVIFKKYGTKNLYVMGKDEAKGKNIEAQFPAWRAIHKVGGKIFEAGYLDEAIDRTGLLDVLVVNLFSAPPDTNVKKFIREYRKNGKIFIYSFPQTGVEDPYIYRRNYGFKIIELNVDGIMDYAYMHGMHNIYNDFDHTTYKDINFVYPTATGVIDTVQWEGYREAMDDIKYFRTLEKAVLSVQKNPKKKQAVIKGKETLEKIINSIKNITHQNSFTDEIIDLSELRQEIIDAIIELKQ